MTFDFFAFLTWMLLAFMAGCLLMWVILTHPDEVDTWMDAHVHSVYVLYHHEPDCPKGYTCSAK